MEAIAWAKETSAFVEKKFSLPKVSVWMDAFGPVGMIRWSIDYPDLASVEKALNAVLADADYWKLIEKASKAQLFIDGSAHDVVAKQI